ncbi:MAG: hypothetical protein ONB44_03960 [candidate division KSB1 bacterium]|nr:hypothetical protein [candidate division KSB1 bacterium]MDZ7301285.1 hypothetical protein [candidate division KSB1 bacterium]MDZ7310830.1 hypothetical protein [candidate division KSB1 bacterium]
MPLSSQGKGISAKTNIELVRLLADEPCHEGAWREFLHRFHKYVAFTIYNACKQLDYGEGIAKVEDLTQEVYVKLLNNNCEPLKRFTSSYENAILKYLKMMALRAVYTDFAARKAQKRQPAGGIISLDKTVDWTIDENRKIELLELLPANDLRETGELVEEIQFCLDKILQGSRHAHRDKLIFEYYLYHGFEPEEIASQLGFNLTVKRVENLISEIKQAIRVCLRDRGITG